MAVFKDIIEYLTPMKRLISLVVLLTVLAACSGDPAPGSGSGPRLIHDVALNPTTPAPTRILSETPLIQPLALTNEIQSPLQVVTVDAAFVLVTPTLPPSKTPTETPTITATPSQSPTPTITVTATATFPVFPTSIIQPITAVVAVPIQEICDSSWFFLDPRPQSCPQAAPTASQGVYQAFQNGYMIWVGSQDGIYVFYNDQLPPRWQVYRDTFDEGMPEDDSAYNQAPGANLWQPRRGFGMLWRGNEAIRNRIGWAVDEFEKPYSVQVQTARDGTFFISEPAGGVFGLLPSGSNWQFYRGQTLP